MVECFDEEKQLADVKPIGIVKDETILQVLSVSFMD
jgi:hypothetical protein